MSSRAHKASSSSTMMTRTAAGDGCTATHHAPHGKIRAFYSGLVNEIAGPPASGKSMLGYIEIITYLHRFAGQAVIIDTIGTFSADVLARLIKDRGGDEGMLDRVQIIHTFNMYGLIDAVQEIQAALLSARGTSDVPDVNVQSEDFGTGTEGQAGLDPEAGSRTRTRTRTKAGTGTIGIVMIDTITNPLSLLMQTGQTQGHDVMVTFTRQLTLLTRLHGVCCIVTNTTVRHTGAPVPASASLGGDGRTATEQVASDVARSNAEAVAAGVATGVAAGLGAKAEADPSRSSASGGGGGGPGGYASSAFSNVTMKPALGTTWPHLTDYCLFIHRVPAGTRRVPGKRGFIQEVVRSRVGGVGQWEMV